MRDYWIWEFELDEDIACISSLPEELEENWLLLRKGVSCETWFPKKVSFELDALSGNVIGDAIPHTFGGFQVISEKLKEIIEKSDNSIEFFPVNIIGHKGKKLPLPYYLMNVLRKINCVNREQSQFDVNLLDNQKIDFYNELVLDENFIPEDWTIFRLTETPKIIVVSDSLSEKIKVIDKCTGPTFVHANDWDSYGVS